MKTLLICLTALSILYSDTAEIYPEITIIDYTEQVLDIIWNDVPDAKGYNIYSRNSSQSTSSKRKVNKNLITSGPHFAFIWEFESGKRERKIKGYEHIISIEAICTTGTPKRFSKEKDNLYFQGYRNILNNNQIMGVIDENQDTEHLPIPMQDNKLKLFVSFMEGPGAYLNELVTELIDPLAVGGCAPVTTILVEILNRWGIYAYKAEGTFIKEYHSFAVVKIDKTEYILDFTADQFIPKVSPVMIPRDKCNINSYGRLSESGKDIYTIAKLYKPEDIRLSDKKEGEIYRKIRDEVMKRIKLN